MENTGFNEEDFIDRLSNVFSKSDSTNFDNSSKKDQIGRKESKIVIPNTKEEFQIKCISHHTVDEEEIERNKNKFAKFYEKIILGNRKWIDAKKSKDPEYFDKLAKPQSPKYLIIGCSDSRLVFNEFTSTEPGDVFTHRNVGNLVIATDMNCQSVVQYGIEYLKVEHILVIGHSDCGAIKAALSSDFHGLIDHWIKRIRNIAEKYIDELNVDLIGHDAAVKKLIELNVREQCLSLAKNPIIQKAWDSGQDLYIHGCVFNMETGQLEELNNMQESWNRIKDVYKFNFKK